MVNKFSMVIAIFLYSISNHVNYVIVDNIVNNNNNCTKPPSYLKSTVDIGKCLLCDDCTKFLLNEIHDVNQDIKFAFGYVNNHKLRSIIQNKLDEIGTRLDENSKSINNGRIDISNHAAIISPMTFTTCDEILERLEADYSTKMIYLTSRSNDFSQVHEMSDWTTIVSLVNFVEEILVDLDYIHEGIRDISRFSTIKFQDSDNSGKHIDSKIDSLPKTISELKLAADLNLLEVKEKNLDILELKESRDAQLMQIQREGYVKLIDSIELSEKLEKLIYQQVNTSISMVDTFSNYFNQINSGLENIDPTHLTNLLSNINETIKCQIEAQDVINLTKIAENDLRKSWSHLKDKVSKVRTIFRDMNISN